MLVEFGSGSSRKTSLLLSVLEDVPAYIPIDIAVRQTDAGVELAVLLQRPSGLIQSADSRLVLYRWSGGADSQAAAR